MDAGRSRQSGKIAIVGIGCRYGNGVDDVNEFWQMLVKGLDCTTPIPPGRFDASYFLSPGEKTPGKIYIQNGGYITQDPYMFDRQFFKMPPDEAAHLDPQVRLLLEVTWEALENAGIPASSLRGTKTGVYMGVTAQEYGAFASKPYHNMNQYSNSGTNSCMVANRISYEFDLRGPSFSVDTACSSSLYSIYLACDALRQGSCSMAIAGGVNLILVPTATIGFCQAGMLSPDGKCKSFDQSADGYSRSEGAGVIVLKPLEAALRDGDRVYAVVRGGALSNDGRTPGIANPSSAAQVDLVKMACRNAGVHPHQIVYAEAHGTGTRVGDSTEAAALGEVLGKQRGPQHPPLYVGSVKSNVGHSEGAAGVAGVIKVALSLYQLKIPPVVHFKTPNENVDFEELKIHIPSELTPWPNTSGSLLSSCSSFGFGGANANLVLEAIKIQQKNAGNLRGKSGTVQCLLLSAATSDALYQKLKDWVEFLDQDPGVIDANFYSYLYTAACRSEHHAYRIGFAVYSREDALSQLRLKLDEETQAHARCVEGVAPPASSTAKPIVFVFSGMGTQWWGMARELMRTQSVFASKIKVIDKLLQNCGAKWSLINMLSDEKNREKINQTDISQPCIYAVAMGLLELWKMRGITPDAVVGHSVGEVAAANAAGLLSTEDAVKIIYRRGRELRKTSGSGKMLAVLHPVEDALKLAKDSKFGELLDVAAINSPTQVVFSGEGSAVVGLANEFKNKDIKCVMLKVNNAFHSKQQEAVKSPFLKKMGKFLQVQNDGSKRSTVPMMSTVTGRYLTPEEANSPDYWFHNIRQKVSFMDAIYTLCKDGYRVFVEIGAHSALLPALRDIFAVFGESEGKVVSTSSLIRPKDTTNLAKDSEIILMSQMRLHVNGIPMKFGSLFSPACRRVLSIPHYPWQREKCSTITEDMWNDMLFPVKEGQHVLLGEERQTSQPSHGRARVWYSELNASKVPWVKDHVLQDAVVVPAAAFTETGLAAARAVTGKEYPLCLEALEFERFMFAPDAEGNLETTVEERTAEKIMLTLRSHDITRGTWTQHCQLRISSLSGEELEQSMGRIIDEKAHLKRLGMEKDGEQFYNEVLEYGFRLGPNFRVITKARTGKDYMETFLYGEAPGSVQREFHRYVYHPAFMDACLQAFAVILPKLGQIEDKLAGRTPRPRYNVPRSIKKFSVFGPTPPRVLVHLQVRSAKKQSCDIDVADAETHVVFCSIRGLVFETIRTDVAEPQIWSMSWNNHGSLEAEDPVPSPANPKTVVIIADDPELCALLEADVETAFVMNTAEPDCVQKTVGIVSNSKDSETLLVIVKTERVSLNSGSVMSKAMFEERQKKGPLFCYSVSKALQAEGLKPNILLFTMGSYQVKEGDAVDPFAASLTSFLTTISQEDPSIRPFNVDLPLDASFAESAAIVREVIVNQENYLHVENILAVRRSASAEEQEKSWQFLSPRLKMEGISKAPGIVITRDWSIGIDNNSKQRRIVVQRSTEQNPVDTNVKRVRVKVDAFSVYKKPDLQDENDSSSIEYVYAGTIDENIGVESVPRRCLGVIISDKVTPYVDVEAADITDVPGYLTCAEAVSIVVKYFSTAVFFNQAVAITNGMNLLFRLDSLDSETLAAVHLATQLGAEVTALNDGFPEDLGFLKIHSKSLNEVLQTSVDVLFLSLRSTSLEGALHSLIPKLKRNATVVIMQRKKEESRLMTLPSKMKMVIFETNFPSAIDGLTDGEISQTLANLFKSMDPENQDIHLVSGPANHRQLSSVAAKNVEIPEGEVIESSSEELLLPLSVAKDDFVANDRCSYLVTGGSKGFGLRLVEWLVSRGARYIYTISRGETNEELQGVIERAERVEAQVRHLQMDVSCAKEVEEGLREMVSDEWPPLKGIFHCAAVFSDAFIQNTTVESWNNVMAPKAYGALLLHQMTQRLKIKLDHFIMTSSIVSLIGNAGQGNYCAANVFLNALAQYRRNESLPATALQIGLISDVGFAERGGLVQKWEKSGTESIGPNEVLRAIGGALSVRQPLLGITGSFNKKLYADSNRGLMMLHFQEKQGTLSMFKDLYEDSETYLTVNDDSSFLQSIMKLPFPKAREAVMETLKKLLGEQLAIGGDVSPESSPLSLGLDSLMATEFSQLIGQQFQVVVGAVELLSDRNTIKKLSDKITKQMLMQVDSGTTGSSENGESEPLKTGSFVVEGEAPPTVGVKLVCFPYMGAGPSVYYPWVQPLLKYNVQMFMIQFPGWEGREDERPLSDMAEITRLIHDELLPHLSEGPFVFFGHSLGSLFAFEVAHRFMTDDNLCPRHLFISSWYSPNAAYPHPKELQSIDLMKRLEDALKNQPKMYTGLLRFEKLSLSFLDNSILYNTALMRRLLPAFQAVMELISDYTNKHTKPLPCDITAFGAKQDHFIPPHLLDGWEPCRSRKNTFKKVVLPGKHMHILTNTAEILKWVCLACKPANSKR